MKLLIRIDSQSQDAFRSNSLHPLFSSISFFSIPELLFEFKKCLEGAEAFILFDDNYMTFCTKPEGYSLSNSVIPILTFTLSALAKDTIVESRKEKNSIVVRVLDFNNFLQKFFKIEEFNIASLTLAKEEKRCLKMRIQTGSQSPTSSIFLAEINIVYDKMDVFHPTNKVLEMSITSFYLPKLLEYASNKGANVQIIITTLAYTTNTEGRPVGGALQIDWKVLEHGIKVCLMINNPFTCLEPCNCRFPPLI